MVPSIGPKSASSIKTVLNIAVNIGVIYSNDSFGEMMQVMKQFGVTIPVLRYNFRFETEPH